MIIPRGSESRIIPIILTKISDGLPFIGITSASANLNISVKSEKASSATAYTGANLEAASTVGTYQAPTSGKVRILEVDSTNKKGEYEIHVAQSILAGGDGSAYFTLCISGVTDLKQCDLRVDFIGPIEISFTVVAASGAGAVTTIDSPTTIPFAVTSRLNDYELAIVDGIGEGQVCGVISYSNASGTSRFNCDRLLATTPDNTSICVIRQRSTGAATAISLSTTQATNFSSFFNGPSQAVRDALKLAASAGAPATNSIDDYIVVIDTLIDAIKAKTDQFVFTVANQVDSNLRQILATGLTAQAAANIQLFFDNLNAATSKIVNDVGTAAAATDWSATERNQIRHRLGIDGTAAAPAADPSLALQTDIPSAATIANLVAQELHLKKNTASQIVTFFMRQISDPKSGATGLTLNVGRAFDSTPGFNAATGTVIEIGSGYYVLVTSQEDTNPVNNHIIYRATATGAIEASREAYVHE